MSLTTTITMAITATNSLLQETENVQPHRPTSYIHKRNFSKLCATEIYDIEIVSAACETF